MARGGDVPTCNQVQQAQTVTDTTIIPIFGATASFALSGATAPGGSKYNYNTGDAYCCNQAEKAETAAGAEIVVGIGAVAQGVTGLFGATCSPIAAIGIGNGASW